MTTGLDGDGKDGVGSSDPDPAFRAARARVEWYFGELLDRVSSDQPVSRHQLVSALARLDGAARRDPVVAKRGEPIGADRAPGRVVRLPLSVWRELESFCSLSEAEVRAVRAVHRRMAESIVAVDPDPSAPSFVFTADSFE